MVFVYLIKSGAFIFLFTSIPVKTTISRKLHELSGKALAVPQKTVVFQDSIMATESEKNYFIFF